MMNILIITTRFFPFGSATSAVVGNLAVALKEKSCNVRIIALNHNREFADSLWNGIPVHHEYVPSIMTKEEIINNIRRDVVKSGVAATGRILNKLFISFFGVYKKYTLNHTVVSAYKKAILKEIRDDDDLCLITLMPMEAIWAMQLSKKRIPVVIYQVDPYWNNDELLDKRRMDRLDLEKKIVKKSLFCMTTPLIYETNTKIESELEGRYVVAEFPCVKRSVVQYGSLHSDGKIHCVFTGTLYKDLRPPEPLISIIGHMNNSDITFDFYGSGQNLVKNSSAFDIAKNRICLHGSVPSEDAERARLSADILINIDNLSTALVPSKIFEYVSTGLPIVNCYFSTESHTLRYLSKYPLCINLDLNDSVTINSNKIVDFIIESKGKRVAFDEICELYVENTPNYVADQLLNAYKSAKLSHDI